tara:strand:- start:1793 stop:2719 length:927 start_codon:yes stop_codon:yes gene_type:complete
LICIHIALQDFLKILNKNYFAYTLLILTTLFWSGNFILGKFSALFQIPPFSLNFFRWLVVWLILIPFTAKEIKKNYRFIKTNLHILFILGITSISSFNSIVYYSLNFTQVINAVLMLSAIPVLTITISAILKIDKIKIIQIFGLVLSIFGVLIIISKGNFEIVKKLNFNKGDLWMLLAAFSWSIYSIFLKKIDLPFSQFTLIQVISTIGLIFLVPQYLYERSIGLEINLNLAFFLILSYVVLFAAIGAYYCWQKAVSIIGPSKSSMFIQLMPLFSAILAILIFKEKFQLFHLLGALFIISGIYLSNKK